MDEEKQDTSLINNSSLISINDNIFSRCNDQSHATSSYFDCAYSVVDKEIDENLNIDYSQFDLIHNNTSCTFTQTNGESYTTDNTSSSHIQNLDTSSLINIITNDHPKSSDKTVIDKELFFNESISNTSSYSSMFSDCTTTTQSISQNLSSPYFDYETSSTFQQYFIIININ